MATFQIQNNDGTLSTVGHKDFFEILNGGHGYLYYKRGGVHIAMLPTAENAETLRICRQADNAESDVLALENRCRDEKGRICRHQHDENGRVIRNKEGNPIKAKCGDCPRNGWTTGKRENCCIRNYCKVTDCTYCPHPRECHTPHSLEWLTEDKSDYEEHENGGYSITDLSANPQDELEAKELTSTLLAALDELPAKERAVLIGIYWDKLSIRDYAALNGMSKSAVHRHYSRALESLKNSLKKFL
jgi:RNA polymerase sigma factor (sigma-70 family)